MKLFIIVAVLVIAGLSLNGCVSNVTTVGGGNTVIVQPNSGNVCNAPL